MAQSQFPESIHAAARALLVVEREPSRRAGEALRRMFPGERIPDDSTLRLWRSQFPEISSEEQALIQQNERSMILRADEALDRYFDVLGDASNADVLRSGMTVNAIRGTMTDKQIHRSKSDNPTTVIPVQIIINNTQ